VQIENATAATRSNKQGSRRVATMNADEPGDNVVHADERLVLKSVWDNDKVVRFHDGEGRPRWRCTWCMSTFASHNATKALFHVARKGDGDIRPCRSRTIEDRYTSAYMELFQSKQKKRDASQMVTESADDLQSQRNITIATRLDGNCRKKQCSTTGNYSTPLSSIVSYLSPQGVTTPSDVSRNSSTRASLSGMQTTIAASGSLHHPTADAQLTMAISDLIHSRGLAFSLASDPKFRKVLKLAKNVTAAFRPPGRNQVAGELLDLNYEAYMERIMGLLKQDASFYGISVFGDGATVKKKALLNVLASGVHIPSACLEIVDCSAHLAIGGKKDAKYIANCFLPFIEKFEAEEENTVDLALFDGASNVQKAGEILAAIFPRMSVVHGAEHVVSLLFNDVFKRKEMRIFIRICRMVYRVFGSGSMHAPYAIFHKYARHHNQGRPIGLIRAADTRMGGHLIAMMRFLRLQSALQNAVTSVEFVDLSKVSFIRFNV